ncbi:hypothetical protein VTK73DRAFT_2887 [Phialemonium thermophilum]|uniref:Uncharacterized protein n=1 Tax=Phialemonium thermophilum TaxID=223376 RepID=A0ABR3VN78_9PEZI
MSSPLRTMSRIAVGRTFSRSLMRLLVVGVEHDLLLVRVLQRLAALHLGAVVARHDARAAGQARQVAPEQIHQHRLGDVVRVVARDHVPDAQRLRAPVQRLAAEHAAVGAVALLAHRLHDLVHGPSVQLVVADDPEGHVVLHRVALHGLERVVSVALDSFVDAEEHEIQAVLVALVERLEDRREHGGILAAGRAYGHLLPRMEEPGRRDGVVHLVLEYREEALLAEVLVVLGPLDERPLRLAESAESPGHDWDVGLTRAVDAYPMCVRAWAVRGQGCLTILLRDKVE